MDIMSDCLATHTIPKSHRKTRPDMERWNCTAVKNAVDEKGRISWLPKDGLRGAPLQSESFLDLDLDGAQVHYPSKMYNDPKTERHVQTCSNFTE